MTDWTVLERAATALTGNAGLFVAREDGTVLYERDADGLYPAASGIKIPILMTVYADAAEGRLSLDERLAVGEHMPGTGVLGHVPGVADLTIRDHAALMTIVSDNTSTNRLMERVGVARIAQRMRECGCVRTQLRRTMLDFEAANRGLDNVATARELAALLLRLLPGELIDRATSDAVLGVLEQTQDDALIRRYLPADERGAQDGRAREGPERRCGDLGRAAGRRGRVRERRPRYPAGALAARPARVAGLQRGRW